MSRIFKPISDLRKEKRRARSLFRIKIAVSLLVCLILFYVLISYSGHWLVKDDSFEHVTWAVILDGQGGDLERSDFAADLVRNGKVDSILVLGRRVFRDKSNADFYAEDLENVAGMDPGILYVFRHDDPSTVEEAVSVVPWFKRKNVRDTVLLLTSAPATRRAAFLFNKLSGGSPVFITADLHSWRFNADGWIFEREARKSWLREWLAYLNAKWEMLGVDSLSATSRPVRSPEPWKTPEVSVPRVKVKTEKLMSIKETIALQDSAAKAEVAESQKEFPADRMDSSSKKQE
ncbi:YdcF family protein [Fibrobacter intestinalis]|uniref:Uncharacterized SAM-binding protein YcdF, DUF218 family n=1 Tax=Fibrobacter intestinalis TaxID=28122 RepID=A0A1T4P942_9BACT|nr:MULTISPECIES: ElyC/SanA/YdcF family protein [Fibrobacter]PBC73012.1 uncharacterized SAM-binding protein YcdF (DUF218 family) [Fibrobacter sp. NR9]SJZ88090.1 Uncharacterized SAM-binding protein YcdF, DUF218 family [Fibrobacter intestinalis]